MEISIGNILLTDWIYGSWDKSCFRTTDPSIVPFECMGSVVVSNNRQSYYPRFTCDLEFLSDIFGERSFASEDEAKKQVDDFLIRMSKLRAFL
jgi:hypothetical protein